MSESFIVRRGGGGGGILFAAIGVTYPAGSTCTCTDGVKTLTAKDTSGNWVFAIPYAATWTVTATDGTSTKSESVEITTSGQSVSVELSYWDGSLYDAGNEYTNLTGGWNGGTKGSDYIRLAASSSYGASSSSTTVNLIDLSGWNTVSVNITAYNASGGRARLRVLNSANAVLATINIGETGLCTLDIASINEACYVQVNISNTSGAGAMPNISFNRVALGR